MKKTQTKIQYNNMYSLKIDYARFSSHQVSTKMVGYLIAMLYFVSDCLFRKLMLWHFVLEIWAISQEPHDHFLQFGHNQRSMTGKTSWSFIMFKSGCARIRAKTLYKKKTFFFQINFFLFLPEK